MSVQLDLVDSRRRLCIRLDVGDFVWAAVYPRKTRWNDQPLASAIGRRKGSPREIDQFSLRYHDGHISLWISDGSFHISEGEALRIEETYREHGLEIHPSDVRAMPSAAVSAP